MLTLGLMEGAILAALQNLVLVAALDMGLPMHRVLGPPAAVLLGIVGWAVWDSGTATVPDALGLLAVAALCFGLPLALMRQHWYETKHGLKIRGVVLRAPVVAPAATRAATTEKVVA
jgi:hypothetical protein